MVWNDICSWVINKVISESAELLDKTPIRSY